MTTMTSGYQIFKFDERFDRGFVSAGGINWFMTIDEAKARKKSLEDTWSKYGVQYIIVDCSK